MPSALALAEHMTHFSSSTITNFISPIISGVYHVLCSVESRILHIAVITVMRSIVPKFQFAIIPACITRLIANVSHSFVNRTFMIISIVTKLTNGNPENTALSFCLWFCIKIVFNVISSSTDKGSLNRSLLYLHFTNPVCCTRFRTRMSLIAGMTLIFAVSSFHSQCVFMVLTSARSTTRSHFL